MTHQAINMEQFYFPINSADSGLLSIAHLSPTEWESFFLIVQQKNQSLPTVLLCALTSDFTGGCPPPPSRSLCERVNLQLQFIKFLVILPFNFQLSLHLERGTHHAY